MHRGRLLALFAVSGAAALIYEVVWTRLLTLQMGHGLAAASTVLAAFMGGLAAGAAAGGAVGGRLSPGAALRTYAGLEWAIGGLALLLPLGLAALDPVLAAAYDDGNGGATFAALRLGSSLLLVAVPAAAMGATFPLASRWVVRHAAEAAREAGRLYAANTLGAAGGAVLAGFVLIPTLGLRGATWVGVGLNIVAAAGAWALASASPQASEARPASASSQASAARHARTGRERTAGRDPQADREAHDREPRADRPALAAVVLGVSGFASLSLQVVWTRLAAAVLGPTTYAFSLVVTAFILGIAGGAAVGARMAARARRPAVGLAACLLASAALSLAAAAAVDPALLWMAHVSARLDLQFAGVLVRQAALVGALLLPATLAFGAAFPFAVALAAARDETVTSRLGLVYAVNTVGAIAGALAAGFALVPLAGLHGAIRLVAMTGAATAAALALITRGRARSVLVGGAALVATLAWWLPRWDPLLLSSGAYKYAAAFGEANLDAALRAGELLSYREGAAGTVAVRRLAGTVSLAIDGKVDASNAGDMLTQRLLAHVPLLLHPNPKRAAIIGLGSGVTLGAALTHPLDEALVLEISPEVVDASRYFDVENRGALRDPRVRLIVGDGRTHLRLGRARYDVIVSEPSNPWMAGIASLFTREFFEAARDRLAPGGVLCQWAHTYDISQDDLKSIVATFLGVFPHGTLWMVGDADVLLVGAAEPLDARMAGMAVAWHRPGVAADLSAVGAQGPFSVLSLFVAQGEALARWAGGVAPQTDDRARLEFSGPRHIVGAARDDNAAALRALGAEAPRPEAAAAAIASATPADWRGRGLMLLGADANRPAFDDLARSLEAEPDHIEALDAAVLAAARSQRMDEARRLLTRLASGPARYPAKLALSRLLATQGAMDEAMRIPAGILQADPGHVPALEQTASILADAGDATRLEPVAKALVANAPANAGSHYYAATLFFMQGRPDQALRAARVALGLDPTHAKAHNLAGACLASMGQREEARRAFEASLHADPREPSTYVNLATLELQSGNGERARRFFSEALTIDPSSTAAREGLLAIANPIK